MKTRRLAIFLLAVFMVAGCNMSWPGLDPIGGKRPVTSSDRIEVAKLPPLLPQTGSVVLKEHGAKAEERLLFTVAVKILNPEGAARELSARPQQQSRDMDSRLRAGLVDGSASYYAPCTEVQLSLSRANFPSKVDIYVGGKFKETIDTEREFAVFKMTACNGLGTISMPRKWLETASVQYRATTPELPLAYPQSQFLESYPGEISRIIAGATPNQRGEKGHGTWFYLVSQRAQKS